MANELTTTFNGTANIYVIIRRISDAKVRDVVNGAWDTWADGDIDDYDLALDPKGGDQYSADAIAALLDDVQYLFIFHKRAGGSPALTDLIIDKQQVFWGTEPTTTAPTPTTGTTGTVYCTVADVESIISAHGVTAFADDNLDGSRSAAETQLVADAISRAAALDINIALSSRYKLSDLSGNVWCKFANAVCAALDVTVRRNNPASRTLAERCKRIRDDLQKIQAGRLQLPDQAESFDQRPTVSNFDVERWRHQTPVRVRTDESTGPDPSGDILRRTAHIHRGRILP